MKLLIGVAVVFVLVVLFLATREGLTGSRTRVFRGVGVRNEADERPLGGGIITSQPLFDMTYTYFDGNRLVSCDECPNPVVCQGCPNMTPIDDTFDMEPRGRAGAARTPVIGTVSRVRGSTEDKFDVEPPAMVKKGASRAHPAASAVLLMGSEPREYVGIGGQQYTDRMNW